MLACASPLPATRIVLCQSPRSGVWRNAMPRTEIDPVFRARTNPVMTKTTAATATTIKSKTMPADARTPTKTRTRARARGRRQERTRERARLVRLVDDDHVDPGGRPAGRITKWDGDRGFGFIRPEGSGGPLFCHITAFQGLETDRNLDLKGKRVVFDKENASASGRKGGPAAKDKQGFERVKAGRRSASRLRNARADAVAATEARVVAAGSELGGGFGILVEDGDGVGEWDANPRAHGTGITWAQRLVACEEDEEEAVAPWRGTTGTGTRRSWASDSDDEEDE